MQRITAGIRKDLILISATIFYAVTVSVVFPYLRYYVDNPDSISYLNIAKEYANGVFELALNAYWSPLISWMLAFSFKWMGNEILAFKVLQVLIGWFALYHFIRMTQVVIHSKIISGITAFIAVPFMVSYGLLNLTPDLLFLAVILFYLRMVSEREFFNSRHFGIIAGVLGVLLYFSKSFGYVFFITHFSILFIKSYLHTREYAFKKHLRKNYLQALAAFFLISSVWVYLISEKYGHLTISENVTLNLSREVAAGPEAENKLPFLSGGLYKPANAWAVNAWEDPGFAIRLTPLHPLSNQSDRQVYKSVLKRNLLSVYYFDFRNQIGFVFLLLLGIFLLSSKRKKSWTNDYFFSMIITLLFFYVGYSLILVHARYTWICSLLMLLLSLMMLEDLLSGKKFQKILIPAAGFLLVALAVKRPVKEILFANDKQIHFSDLCKAVLHPISAMKHTYNTDIHFSLALNDLKEVICPGENIISMNEPETGRDAYTRTSLLAFVSGAKYYGQLETSDLKAETPELKKIRHVISFVSSDETALIKNGIVVFKNEEIPLTVYTLER